MSAEYCAEARRIFNERDAEHRAAVGKARSIGNRIEWTRARQQAITAKRLAGEASEADTAEFAALTGDLKALENMRVEAEAAAAALDPREARANVEQAERQHAREQLEAQYLALRQKVAEIESVFCRGIGELHQLGLQLGHVHLSQSWRASETLDRATRLGVPPKV